MEQLTDRALIRSKKREPDATRRYYISDLVSRVCHYVPLPRRMLILRLCINVNRASRGMRHLSSAYELRAAPLSKRARSFFLSCREC